MADKTASFSIDLEDGTSGPAEQAASALERLNAKMKADTASIRQMEASMRNMQRGTQMNVGAFRELQAAIDAKRSSLAAATASYVQLGGSFDKVSSGARRAGNAQKQAADQAAASARKAAAATRQLAAEQQRAGNASAKWNANVAKNGPQARQLGAGARSAKVDIGALGETTEALGGRAGAAAGRAKQLAQALGKAGAAGAAVAVAVVVAVVVVALVALAAKLTMTAIKAADAARSWNLLGQAATGSAAGAKGLEQSVTNVTRSVAISREEAGALALELARAGLSGQSLEKALHASALASKTMGESAGQKLKDLATEAQKAGKTMWKALDFEGAGVSFDAVATELGKQLGIGFEQAKAQLEAGRVTVDQGLSALDAATTKKLGAIGKKQLLGFDHQISKAKENVGQLFAGVNVEPFLKALQKVLSLLDESTSTGRALKVLMTTVMDPLLEGIAKVGPPLERAFKKAVIAALMFVVAVLKVKKALHDVSTDAERFAEMMTVATSGTINPNIQLDLSANKGEAQSAGKALTEGIAAGLDAKAGSIIAKMSALGVNALAAFKSAAEISSPSRAMKRFGRFMGAGAEEGLEDSEAGVEDAADSLARAATPEAEPSAGARGDRSGGSTTIHIAVNVAPGADKRIMEQPFLERLAEAVETAVRAGGGEIEVPS